jgi:formamidopyrimidine-DNA glycosylase
MPELPDITIYLESLERRILHQPLQQIRLASPFVLRTAVPPIHSVRGQDVIALGRLGKRIAFGFRDDLWLVLHLMIAGRLHWREPAAKLPGKVGLAAFDFPHGTLILTEAGTKKRASCISCKANRRTRFDPGGLEVLGSTCDAFARALKRRNHTLKRALTDPRLFSGIGNAYSANSAPRALVTRGLDPEAFAGRDRASPSRHGRD